MNELSLTGKRALVIGGSSGIGFAIAKGMQEAGAKVAVAARTAGKVENAVGELRGTGSDARGFVVDVNDTEKLGEVSRAIEQDFGPLDIVVQSQGTTIIKPAVEFSPADYDTVLTTNLKSLFFASIAFGKPMLARGSGAFINIASLAGHRGWPNAAAYSMSKHGVVGLTKSLAGEWASHGVRVNAISPGFFLTELNRGKMSEARKARLLDRTPLGRFGEVEELAGAAVYLASPAARFVTGTVVEVDGGYLGIGI